MILTPTNLKSLCEKYRLRPSKSYGQNYLVNDFPIAKMIEAAELKKTDTVVEVGPGFGILTFAVLPLVNKVIAFEIERKLEAYWEEKQKEHENVEIIWGDALKHVSRLDRDKSHIAYHGSFSYKLLANLPYQITSKILRAFLEAEYKPEKIVIMVQKEVAERICAKPGGMSILAVSVQYYGTPRIVARVPKGNFWPEPKVDSAVLAIDMHNIQPSPKDAEAFFRIVRAGFANKRKQLWRNLSVGLGMEGERVKQALREAVGNEKIRAEEVGVDEWKDIKQILDEY